ncbi:hypothetical protein ACWEOZ_30450 [Actinoplanes sp. NPDC004185]
MPEPLAPWWKEAHDAARLLASSLEAAAANATRDGVYAPPPGSPPPRRRRRPGSLRHLAEVIRTGRLAPGVSVDKDIVAGVLAGDLRYLTQPVLVTAVARAAHLIARVPFDEADAERLTVACAHVGALVEAAEEADRRAPSLLPASRGAGIPQRAEPARTADDPELRDEPVIIDATFTTRRPGRRRVVLAGVVLLVLALAAAGLVVANRADEPAGEAACRADTVADDVIVDTPRFFDDDLATRLSPTLDFDQMNGSARYARHQGRTYYWGRAGSDDHDPHSGGARIRWRAGDGQWHNCPAPLAVTERGYVHTPAVATTIGGQPVTVQTCLWRDTPRRENCTPEIRNG